MNGKNGHIHLMIGQSGQSGRGGGQSGLTFEPEDVQGGRITRAADFSVRSDEENLDLGRDGEQSFCIGRKIRVRNEPVELLHGSAGKRKTRKSQLGRSRFNSRSRDRIRLEYTWGI